MQRKYLIPCYGKCLESEKFSVKWKWNKEAKWKMKTYYNNYNYSILTFEVILTFTDVSQKCIKQKLVINCILDLNCCFGTPLMLIVCISNKMLHCTCIGLSNSWLLCCSTATTTLALYHTHWLLLVSQSFFSIYSEPTHH